MVSEMLMGSKTILSVSLSLSSLVEIRVKHSSNSSSLYCRLISVVMEKFSLMAATNSSTDEGQFLNFVLDDDPESHRLFHV